MFSQFPLRKNCIIGAMIASTCLVAFFWADSGREGIARLANAELVGIRNGSPDKDSRTEALTKSHHGSPPLDYDGSERPPSHGSDTTYAFPGFSFGASQWPRQSAGAYCALQSSNGVSEPIGGMIEKRLATHFLTCRVTGGFYNCDIQGTTEPGDIGSLWQFRWNEFHQHSPTSQGSVMVNF
jgi:hypothetical protein